MSPGGAIPADLVTPLGAYLRLREPGGGSFLLESVERGRLGRYSFVGAGSRLVSFEEAELLDAPVVGYLSYEHAARLEPTVPVPPDGPPFPESRFVLAETLVRLDHGAGVLETLVGDPDEVAASLDAPVELPAREAAATPQPLRRHPAQARYEEMVRICQEHIRAISS